MDDIIDVPTKWFNWADQSSPVHFLGTHCYDLIRWYMGCEVTEVYAVGTKEFLKSKGVDTYDPINDFVRCLQNDLPFIADAKDGLEAEKIAEAVHKSVETASVVKLKREGGQV